MKKVALALAAFTILALGILPAGAVSGYDGDVYGTGYFQILVAEDSNPGHGPQAPPPFDVYEREQFNLADGWDFGDRISYGCAFVEYFETPSNEKFEVHYELVADYPHSVSIIDKFGAQAGHPCGTEISNGEYPTLDPTVDHFPHMIHPGDGLTFAWPTGSAFLDLTVDHCSRSYWTPGDEAGEAWLWWDEDGPTFSHGPGDGDVACGGGEGEPIAVVRLIVMNQDADVSYCTHSQHEEWCSGTVPPTTTTPVPTTTSTPPPTTTAPPTTTVPPTTTAPPTIPPGCRRNGSGVIICK